MTPQQKTLREWIHDRFTAALGTPDTLPSAEGPIFRWRLRRAESPAEDVFVTLDSPELRDAAHVLLSDPASSAAIPVTSFTMRSTPEVETLLASIKRRVRGFPPPPATPAPVFTVLSPRAAPAALPAAPHSAAGHGESPATINTAALAPLHPALTPRS